MSKEHYRKICYCFGIVRLKKYSVVRKRREKCFNSYTYVASDIYLCQKTAPLRQIGINSDIFQIQKNPKYAFCREFYSE